MNKLKKKFNKLDDKSKKTIILIGSTILIALVILLSSLSRSSENFKNIKLDKSNYLVYSKVEKKDANYPKYVPYINIKGDIVDQVNRDIDNFVGNYVDSDKSLITYEYNINGIILSVVVKILDYKNEYAPRIYFRSYNINLDTLKLISDQSLLDFFQTNEEEVSAKIENKFNEYYTELVKEGYYVTEECDYKCFLGYRDISNYLDDVNYYVKNGDLIAYRPFIFYSIFGDEEFFKEEHFEFLLVETEKN